MDERIPQWVKTNYSPREQWKNRPFTRQDALFFLKGIRELSELFTDDRPSRMPNYFSHPKFRSSYLLYFLPLQAAKFFSLFHAHHSAIEKAIDHARSQGVLRVVDLGSGPGTASIALLIYLIEHFRKTGESLPPVELEWFDINRRVLEEGKKLVQDLCEIAPELKNAVVIQTHAKSWTEAHQLIPHSTSLVLVGNMLNEENTALRAVGTKSASHSQRHRITSLPSSSDSPGDFEEEWNSPEELQNPLLQSPAYRALSQWIKKAEGGGILIVEPAAKTPSRLLAHLRDSLFEMEVIPQKRESLWGPCLHAGKCPLSQGRDWCHFSIPSEIPGENFKFFSKGLGSERHWLKFSFLWLAALDAPASHPKSTQLQKRVISDVIHPPGGSSGIQKDKGIILLCEPEQASRISSKVARSEQGLPLQRGDFYSPQNAQKNSKPNFKQKEPTLQTRGEKRNDKKGDRKIQVHFKKPGRSR